MSTTDTPHALGHANDVVQWLQTREAYTHAPEHIDRIDTHISVVFLTGPFVYKLKKPVKYKFLDFSTLEAREHACREEVRLNTRLAPGVYLGVEPITLESDGSFALNRRGDVIEWLVKMRQLPVEKTLVQMHRLGQLRPYHIEQLANILVSFCAAQGPTSDTPAAYREAYLGRVQDNHQSLLSGSHLLNRPDVLRTQGFQLQLLQLRPKLFDVRVNAKRILEGHGDLRPEHICFSEPIAIFDCIEFNADLRRIDAADELAFLATECDFIGAGWVGAQLFALYRDLSGDNIPHILFDFYKAYRACVRAKVALLRADQLDGPAAEQAVAEANAHLRLANVYSAPHLRPLVLVIGGLPGVGKSTLAAAVAEALGARLLQSDVVRKEVYKGVQEGLIDEGVYRPELRQGVYEEMTRRATNLHHDGISVVIDATYSSAASIRSTHALMSNLAGPGLFIECKCRPEVAHARILARLHAGGSPSEATIEVFEHRQNNWESWPAGVPQVQVDTEQSIIQQVNRVITSLIDPT